MHKLTKACAIAPLDIDCLIRMSLVSRQGNTFKLMGVREAKKSIPEPVDETVDEEEPLMDLGAAPSTSSGILERLEQLELGQRRIEECQLRMEQYWLTYF